MKDLFDLVECHQPTPPEFIDAPPIARNTDPETSHLAAARITRSGDRAAHMDLMLAAVAANPGRTSGELAFISGLERHEASRPTALPLSPPAMGTVHMTDLAALEAASREHPEEDAPFLQACDALSDAGRDLERWRRCNLRWPNDPQWQEELRLELERTAGEEPCKTCDGEGVWPSSASGYASERRCDPCSGTGVRSNRHRERAELYAVQGELEGMPRPDYCERQHNTSQSPSHWCDLCHWEEKTQSLRSSERELIRSGVGWGWWELPGLPKPVVDAHGTVLYPIHLERPHGGIFTSIVAVVRHGNIAEIALPAAAFARELCAAVWSRFPVTKVTLTDAVPDEIGDEFCWLLEREGIEDRRAMLLQVFYRMLSGGKIEKASYEWQQMYGHADEWTIYSTRELALLALSNAATDWGRSCAGLPAMYTKEVVR